MDKHIQSMSITELKQYKKFLEKVMKMENIRYNIKKDALYDSIKTSKELIKRGISIV